jgi:hypothetical protein
MGELADWKKLRSANDAVSSRGKCYEVTAEAKTAAAGALRGVPTVDLRDMVRFLLPDVGVNGHPAFDRSSMLTLLTWAKENMPEAPPTPATIPARNGQLRDSRRNPNAAAERKK